MNVLNSFKRCTSRIASYSPRAYGVFYLVLIPFFSFLYSWFGKFGGSAKLVGVIDYVYFSVVTITTLGYGDSYPEDSISKILCSMEAILGIVSIGLFLNAISQEISKSYKEESEKRLKPLRDQVYFMIFVSINEFINNLFKSKIVSLDTDNFKKIRFGKLFTNKFTYTHDLSIVKYPDTVKFDIQNLLKNNILQNVDKFIVQISSLKSELEFNYSAHINFINKNLPDSIFEVIRQCEYFIDLLRKIDIKKYSESSVVTMTNNQLSYLLDRIDNMQNAIIEHADEVSSYPERTA